MSINEGGAAFPIPNDASRGSWDGMTLRDYFAAKAMVAIYDSAFNNAGAQINKIAFRSYEIADAMLAEREKSK